MPSADRLSTWLMLVLGGFVVGATIIGFVQRGRDGRANSDPVAAGTFVVAGLVAGTAVALHLLALPELTLELLTGLIAFAMGAQAARRPDGWASRTASCSWSAR